MTRRDWLIMLALGLCAGCARTAVHDADSILFDAATGRTIMKESASAPPMAAATAPTESPYHPLPPAAAAPSAPAPAPAPSPVPAEMPTIKAADYFHTPNAEEPTPAKPASLPPPEANAPPTTPAVPEAPVSVALRYMLENKPADAVATLNKYGQPNQDMLMSLLSLCARVSEQGVEKTSPKEIAITIEHLMSLEVALRNRAALVLDKMCFCKWIEKFGVFESLPEGQTFTPGALVQIYVELRNFASEQRAQCYETHLASTVKLLDAENKVAAQWGFTDGARPECSQTLRHDYFINYSLRIPANVPPGRYKLLLRVDDLPTKRTVEHSLPLDVTARTTASE